MKKILYILLLAVIALYLALPVICGEEPTAPKNDAQYIINRTAAIILTAQRFAAQGKNYEGLGLAITHQLVARDFYSHGSYRKAIFQSLYARKLAAHVIAKNKNNMLSDALFDLTEEKYLRNLPPGETLEQRLRDSSITIMNDQAASNTKFSLNVD